LKWLKLDCDFRNDPKIQALAREWGGQEAAGFWCLLLTFVAAHGGPECRVTIDNSTELTYRYITKWLGIYPAQLQKRLTRAADLQLIELDNSWEIVPEQLNKSSRTVELKLENSSTKVQLPFTIRIPKMLKRVDDYTRKVHTNSGQSPKIPHTEEEVEEEKEKKLLRSRLEAGFEKLWDKYPSKDGRKQAEKHFWASVKTDLDLIAIQKALQNYLVHLSTTDWKRPKNGSTWFNNWSDWVDWQEPELVPNGHKPTWEEVEAERKRLFGKP
jgi:hypothetical protein